VNILDDITGDIGRTPLIRLRRLATGLPGDVIVKHEARNPMGSLKDRIAVHMVDDALARGELRPGMVIVEPTSGNTGIGLAQAAVVRGLSCVIVMPDSATVERQRVLSALAAVVVLTPAEAGIPGAIERAGQIAEHLGERAWSPRQTDNANNPGAHFATTGPEIWTDTDGRIDTLVAGVGTGGTITGTGGYLRQQKADLHVVAVQPSSSPLLTGGAPGPHLQTGLSGGFLAPVLDTEVYDEVIDVSDDDAYATARALARQEALVVGASSGAVVAAALQVAARGASAGRLIVAVLFDNGERYLSTPLFTDLPTPDVDDLAALLG
jgi:cysteine synthase A